MSQPVRVELGERSYDVRVGAGELARLGSRVRGVLGAGPARALLVGDAGVPEASLGPAIDNLRAHGFAATIVRIAPSEAVKSLATLELILRELTRTRHERTDPVIAVGGGIVGDLAGFAAATYRRGVPVVQCPSTLLAMVDAAVGGKTGVNLDAGDGGGPRKNMVGAFWQPRLVIADVSLLRSLPARELRAGLAECVKHALIAGGFGDAGLFGETMSLLPRVMALDGAALESLVQRNVALKARVVAGDEREESDEASSGRALLNLGHTFGHAIEPLRGLTLSTGERSPILHGEAVALGLIAASACAASIGVCPNEVPEQVRAALTSCGLPTKVGGLPSNSVLLDAMMHDKKVVGGHLRLVLPAGAFAARVVRDLSRERVEAALEVIRL